MRIAFISTMVGSPWGGSEELWSQAALRLGEQGFTVSASVHGWTPLHQRVLDLRRRGIEVHARPTGYPIWRRGTHRIVGRSRSLYVADAERFLAGRKPTLVVISDGGPRPPIEFIELCVEKGLPFVTIGQANHDGFWLEDGLAQRYRAALSAALRCYFVSEANRRLAEKQTGCTFANAEVVRNPFSVPYDAAPRWPSAGEMSGLRMACVARLHPPSKGQDILFEALAGAPWTARDWTLSLYGEGPHKDVLMRLAKRLGLGARVTFRGHIADVAGIWAENHVLVLPSRYEGLPLSLVEAMLCFRPAVATDIAGHAEVISDGLTGFLAEFPAVPSLHRALERVWKRRGDLRVMGDAAGKRIRELVPPNPVDVFANKLKTLIDVALNPRAAAK